MLSTVGNVISTGIIPLGYLIRNIPPAIRANTSGGIAFDIIYSIIFFTVGSVLIFSFIVSGSDSSSILCKSSHGNPEDGPTEDGADLRISGRSTSLIILMICSGTLGNNALINFCIEDLGILANSGGIFGKTSADKVGCFPVVAALASCSSIVGCPALLLSSAAGGTCGLGGGGPGGGGGGTLLSLLSSAAGGTGGTGGLSGGGPGGGGGTLLSLLSSAAGGTGGTGGPAAAVA